jgi:hypothetical protein
MATIQSYNILHRNMFSADFNANDFFDYSSAQAVSIAEEDFPWVLEHIEKHGQDGMNACLCYIQNQAPLSALLSDKLKMAIQELVDSKQSVHGDIDWEFYHYNTKGPYRNIEDLWN